MQSSLKLNKTLFVFGTGRSGTTMILRLLSCHPEFAWISKLNEKYPNIYQLSLLSRIRNIDFFSGNVKGIGKIVPMPAEAIAVPRAMTQGQFQTQSIINSKDFDHTAIRRYRQQLCKIMKWQGKSRLLHKHTGFARLQYLSNVDNQGKFLQVIRDGRAVAYSLTRVPWWDGTLNSWWWGKMPEEYKEEYKRSQKDPIILAGIVWKRLLDLTEEELRNFNNKHVKTITYNDFVEEPMKFLEEICLYAQLEFSHKFINRTKKFAIHNADDSWKKNLQKNKIDILEKSLGKHLEKYGFSL